MAELTVTIADALDAYPGRLLFDLMNRQMMLNYKADDCYKISGALGKFLAMRQISVTKDQLSEIGTGKLRGRSPLYVWLKSIKTRDALTRLFPSCAAKANPKLHPMSKRTDVNNNNNNGYDEIPLLHSRLIQALAALGDQNSICFEDVAVKMVLFNESQVILNATNEKVFGPRSLEAAMFFADILLVYFNNLSSFPAGRLFEMVREFCKRYEDVLDKEASSEQTKQKIWAEIGLLTGWEYVRRILTEDDSIKPAASAPVSDDEERREWAIPGLRLISVMPIDLHDNLVDIALLSFD